MSTVVSSLGDPRRPPGSPSGRQLPFHGRTFYLDLSTYAGQRRLERDIACLGGKVDKFLSKQVTHVVTSKPPTVSPPSRRDSAGSTPEPVVLSRGLALLKLSGRTQSPAGGKSCVAARARQLGVAVVSLADVLDLIARHAETHPIIAHTTGKAAVRRLRGVFIKIEDECDRYRPIMQRFQSFPAVVADSTHDTSPFYKNQCVKASVAVKTVESARCSSKSVTQPSRKAVQKKTLKKEGFCECCDVCFDDEREHRRTETHRKYANCDDNYASLDDVISKLSSIEHLLDTFHSEPSDHDSLHNATCHTDVSTLTRCDSDKNPIQLKDDVMSDTDVSKDENNNRTKTTNNIGAVDKTMHEKRSLSDRDDAGEMAVTLSPSVTQQRVPEVECAAATDTEESTDEYDVTVPGNGHAAYAMSSHSSTCVVSLRVNQCDIASDGNNRPTVPENGDIRMVGDADVQCARLTGQKDDLGNSETEAVDTGQGDQQMTITMCSAEVSKREADTGIAEFSLPRILLQDDDIELDAYCTDITATKTVEATCTSGVDNETVTELCGVSDMPNSDVYDTAEDTRCVSSRDASRDNRDTHNATATSDDQACVISRDMPLTELTLSDVDICEMLDANFEAQDTQLLSLGNLSVSSSNIEVDACAEYPSLTHLLQVVDDLQTLCLTGNVITDYLNDAATSEVDIVTVDGGVSDGDQPTVTSRCTRCRSSGYTSCCCAEDRSSNDTIDYDMSTGTRLSGSHDGHVSPITVPAMSPEARSQTDVNIPNIDTSTRSPDSESLRSLWVNSLCKFGGYSEDATFPTQCANIAAMKSCSPTGGDICQTESASDIAIASSAETISLTGTRTVVSRCQDNDDAICSALSSTQTSELQNVGNAAENHWTIAPSGGMSVKLSRVAATPGRRDDHVTWSVEKCGDCSLRFSINKQRLAPPTDADNCMTSVGVTSVSREPTKRRKLF